MNSVDVDIYVSQIVKFFESNPKELKTLIGEIDKSEFYQKIKEAAMENFTNGEDVTLTRNQLIQIVVSIHNKNNTEAPAPQGFMRTKYGDICLN